MKAKRLSKNIFQNDEVYNRYFFLRFKQSKTEKIFHEELQNEYESYLTYAIIIYSLLLFIMYGLSQTVSPFMLVLAQLCVCLQLYLIKKAKINSWICDVVQILSQQTLFSLLQEKCHPIQMMIYYEIEMVIWNQLRVNNFLYFFIYNVLALVFNYAVQVILPVQTEKVLCAQFDLRSYCFVQLVAILFYIFKEKQMRTYWIECDSYQKSEKLYRGITDECNTPFITITTTNKILEMNRAAQELFSDIHNRNLSIQQLFDEKTQINFDLAKNQCLTTSMEQRLLVSVRISNASKQRLEKIQEIDKFSLKDLQYSPKLPQPLMFEENLSSQLEKEKNVKQPNEILQTMNTEYFNQINSNTLKYFELTIKLHSHSSSKCLLITFADYTHLNKFIVRSNFQCYQVRKNQELLLNKLETEYQKWHNMIALNVIKQTDLNLLSSTIAQMYAQKTQLEMVHQIHNQYLNIQVSKNVNIHLQHLAAEALETISQMITEQQLDSITLTFDEALPEIVSGDYNLLFLVMHTLLFIIVNNNESKTKISLNGQLLQINQVQINYEIVFQFDFQCSKTVYNQLNFILQYDSILKQSQFEMLSKPEFQYDNLTIESLSLINQLILQKGWKLRMTKDSFNETSVKLLLVIQMEPASDLIYEQQTKSQDASLLKDPPTHQLAQSGIMNTQTGHRDSEEQAKHAKKKQYKQVLLNLSFKRNNSGQQKRFEWKNQQKIIDQKSQMLNSYNESKPKKLEPKHTALEIRMMNQLKAQIDSKSLDSDKSPNKIVLPEMKREESKIIQLQSPRAEFFFKQSPVCRQCKSLDPTIRKQVSNEVHLYQIQLVQEISNIINSNLPQIQSQVGFQLVDSEGKKRSGKSRLYQSTLERELYNLNELSSQGSASPNLASSENDSSPIIQKNGNAKAAAEVNYLDESDAVQEEKYKEIELGDQDQKQPQQIDNFNDLKLENSLELPHDRNVVLKQVNFKQIRQKKMNGSPQFQLPQIEESVDNTNDSIEVNQLPASNLNPPKRVFKNSQKKGGNEETILEKVHLEGSAASQQDQQKVSTELKKDQVNLHPTEFNNQAKDQFCSYEAMYANIKKLSAQCIESNQNFDTQSNQVHNPQNSSRSGQEEQHLTGLSNDEPVRNVQNPTDFDDRKETQLCEQIIKDITLKIWDRPMLIEELQSSAEKWVVDGTILAVIEDKTLIGKLTESVRLRPKFLHQCLIAKSAKTAKSQYLKKLKQYQVFSYILIDTNLKNLPEITNLIRQIEETLECIPKTLICGIDEESVLKNDPGASQQMDFVYKGKFDSNSLLDISKQLGIIKKQKVSDS